jgi:tRNA (guanine37-N1)-methyltransferase
MPKTAPCLKVPKSFGEKAIAAASKLKLVDKTLAIERDEEYLCIPLVRQPYVGELEDLGKQVAQTQICTYSFTQKTPPTQTLMQALEDQLPSHLLAALPQALDIIGDIVVIEILVELAPYQKIIGEAILKTHNNICTVLAKASDIQGTFRIRDYTFIAGENKTQTIHREFGCTFHVDIAKAYFSPRLSHEHERVASLVQGGETVVDLFAGIGPFSVLIAKRNPKAKVYAVDLNPDAVELLKVNVRANRVDNRVFPVCADAREIANGNLKGVADRVIMNLPETAIDFADAACQTIKPQGGTIHFYAFIRQPDTIENLQKRFTEKVEAAGRKVEAFTYAHGIRETAPFESQVVLDAKIV